ncbi:glutathione binding-like protein [Phenylobacterium sp.]|jgi:glutathione S-transferase|uniref:glutathione binding-like protein n=1 Tax=Phenylobacterium sp. TaxID=1871053 RepID=UPI002F94BDB1
MDLYFSPLSCSLASRIALAEAGAEAQFHRVNTREGRTADGGDYRRINPKGLVPALRTEEGEVLTENAAILQYIADRYPEAGLAPDGFERYRLQQWLSFVATELHKLVFQPLFNPSAPDAVKSLARELAASRFAYLDEHLEGREYLLDRFSVADCYLAAVLNWPQAVKLDISGYKNVVAYRERLMARPAVAKATQDEFALYQAA